MSQRTQKILCTMGQSMVFEDGSEVLEELSGPIEAAHRSVPQQRMKLFGQRWSEQGAQAIANLRCYRKADQWHLVQMVISAAA